MSTSSSLRRTVLLDAGCPCGGWLFPVGLPLPAFCSPMEATVPAACYHDSMHLSSLGSWGDLGLMTHIGSVGDRDRSYRRGGVHSPWSPPGTERPSPGRWSPWLILILSCGLWISIEEPTGFCFSCFGVTFGWTLVGPQDPVPSRVLRTVHFPSLFPN